MGDHARNTFTTLTVPMAHRPLSIASPRVASLELLYRWLHCSRVPSEGRGVHVVTWEVAREAVGPGAHSRGSLPEAHCALCTTKPPAPPGPPSTSVCAKGAHDNGEDGHAPTYVFILDHVRGRCPLPLSFCLSERARGDGESAALDDVGRGPGVRQSPAPMAVASPAWRPLPCATPAPAPPSVSAPSNLGPGWTIATNRQSRHPPPLAQAN